MTQKEQEEGFPQRLDLGQGEKPRNQGARANLPTDVGSYESDNLGNPLANMEKIYQTSDFERSLQELCAIDFVLMDLTLYLDTHPEDAQAIAQYNHLAMERNRLKEAYEARFGPLTARGGSYSPHPWMYSKTPWPWQV